MFLGCHIAERVLSHVFKDVERMPLNNVGYDFICNKGFKIDVKASCSNKGCYKFAINRNKIPHYFLCIGFDNRENLNPQHIWLIKNDEVTDVKKFHGNKRQYIWLSELPVLGISMRNLSKFSRYELTNKSKETIECCNKLRESNKVSMIKEVKDVIVN